MTNDDWEHASYEAHHKPSCDYCTSMATRLDVDSNDREAYLNLKNCDCSAVKRTTWSGRPFKSTAHENIDADFEDPYA